MRRAVLALCVLLGGCHATYALQWGAQAMVLAPAVTANVLVAGPATGTAGAIIVGVAVADGVRYYTLYQDGTRVPYYGTPEADPGRTINVQDCTRPVDPKAGNLMCR